MSPSVIPSTLWKILLKYIDLQAYKINSYKNWSRTTIKRVAHSVNGHRSRFLQENLVEWLNKHDYSISSGNGLHTSHSLGAITYSKSHCFVGSMVYISPKIRRSIMLPSMGNGMVTWLKTFLASIWRCWSVRPLDGATYRTANETKNLLKATFYECTIWRRWPVSSESTNNVRFHIVGLFTVGLFEVVCLCW